MSHRLFPKEFITEKHVDEQAPRSTPDHQSPPAWGGKICLNPGLVSVLSSEAKPGI